jgi:uncharacterized protein involved in response to NO
MAAEEPFGLWGRAFRPFFLGGAIHAALVIPWWTLVWLGVLGAPAWLAPTFWHGHEMVFGFVAAAIAGFLLTASPVWSGGPVLNGRPLAVLFGVWVLGRLAFVAAGPLPAWAVAAVDLAFLPGVAAAVVRTLWGSGQLRNYGIVGVVLALAAANAMVHAEAVGWAPGAARPALRFAVDAVIVLILVVGGRITPAFTQNAFRMRGIDRSVRSWPALNRATIGLAVAVALAGLALGRTPVTGVVAVAAGLVSAARLSGWQGSSTRGDPLLWSLHLALAWVSVGLVLVGLGDLGVPIPATAGLHALTAGAMGSAIMAVTTRVALGHTGRALSLPAGVVACYALVHAAALARVAAPFLAADGQRALLLASGLAWACAFGLFAFRYASILTSPRVDGLPG